MSERLCQHMRARQDLTAVAGYVNERLVGYVGAVYAEPVQETIARARYRDATATVRCRLYAAEHPKWTARIILGPYEEVIARVDDTQTEAEGRAQAHDLAQWHRQRLVEGGEAAQAKRNRLVREKDFIEWVEPIKQLKREGQHEEALQLLTECIRAAEHEARRNR
jgi:hypothetical protein